MSDRQDFLEEEDPVYGEDEEEDEGDVPEVDDDDDSQHDATGYTNNNDISYDDDEQDEAAAAAAAAADDDDDDDGERSERSSSARRSSSVRGSSMRRDSDYEDTDGSSSRKSSSRTDALYEHAIWKAKKLQEKRDQLRSQHDFTPKTNSRTYHGASGGTVTTGRASVYERLYGAGSRQRAASLTAKRREIDDRETLGSWSKHSKKPGHELLFTRVPPSARGDHQDNNYDTQSEGGGGGSSGRRGSRSSSRGGFFAAVEANSNHDARSRRSSSSSSRTSTRRTDALYLESILREQRRAVKLRDREEEHSFQPDLSRGRSLYREPSERVSQSVSVHNRLYDEGSRKREFTQDVVARIYSRSRIARSRRMAEYAHSEGAGMEVLDHNGDFLDNEINDLNADTRSLAGFSVAGSATSSTHTQRTDALYLEATLRRARRDEKEAARAREHPFQPLTNIASPAHQRRSFSAGGAGRYQTQSEGGMSRHDLLYMDGERKRQRNLDARYDPNQKGTGELVYQLNRKWSDSSRSGKLVPGLLRQEDLRRRSSSLGRHSLSNQGYETRSLSDFSVGTDKTGGGGGGSHSGRSHTRRTEALYLESSLRAARKQAMREAYAKHGFTFQPSVKATGRWASRAQSLNNVVSRLYDPDAILEKKAQRDQKKADHELRAFTGKPKVKGRQASGSGGAVGRSRQMESDPFERLHSHAEAQKKFKQEKAARQYASERKSHTFTPALVSRGGLKGGALRGGFSWTKHQTQPARGASMPTRSAYDPMTGRASSASASSPEKENVNQDDEKKPPTALERFRLRQAERAKKREIEDKLLAEAGAAISPLLEAM